MFRLSLCSEQNLNQTFFSVVISAEGYLVLKRLLWRYTYSFRSLMVSTRTNLNVHPKNLRLSRVTRGSRSSSCTTAAPMPEFQTTRYPHLQNIGTTDTFTVLVQQASRSSDTRISLVITHTGLHTIIVTGDSESKDTERWYPRVLILQRLSVVRYDHRVVADLDHTAK